jgi:hypothetical protein
MTRKGRRRRGEGAVYQRASDGLWVGMLDLGIIAGQRRRKTVYGQTEREAIEKLSTLRAAHDRGIDLLAPALTVRQGSTCGCRTSRASTVRARGR